MFQNVATTCTRYLHEVFPKTPGWTVPKNFPRRLEEFQGVVAEMQTLAHIQRMSAEDAKVATKATHAAQERLHAHLMVIRQAARALRWEIPGLAEKSRVLPLRSSHSAWRDMVQSVLDCAAPHLDALIDEGVPADTLERIQQADADFAKAIAKGVQARQERSRATQELPKLITRGHQLLRTLAITMRAYYAAHPENGSDAAWMQVTRVRRDRRRSRSDPMAAMEET